MATLPVYDRAGAEVGRYEIDPAEIAPAVNKQLIHDVVVMYQANRRLGTVRTKGRSDVSGSTKKMYRQKGTGNARAGSRRSGVRRGGGHIHNLLPRDYSYSLPRKAVQLATRMALASRLADNEVTLLNELTASEPKTSEMAKMLRALNLDGQAVLVAVPSYDVNVYKSLRNIPNVSVLPVAELNALCVLRPRRVVMTTAALDAFRAKAAASAGKRKAAASAG